MEGVIDHLKKEIFRVYFKNSDELKKWVMRQPTRMSGQEAKY
jgi:hypothetical protein